MRISVFNALSFSLLLILFSNIIYFKYKNELFSDLDIKLRNDLEISDDHIKELLDLNSHFKIENILSPENWLLEVWISGNRIFSTSASNSYPLLSKIEECTDRKDAFSLPSYDGLDVRVFCQKSSTLGNDYVIRVARLSADVEQDLQKFRGLIILSFVIILLVSGLLAFWLARINLSPIARMAKIARSIRASSLSERIEVINSQDELGNLATSFNETLDSLEKSFDNMKKFSSDASHELRTPLQAIRLLGESGLNSKMVDIKQTQEIFSNILEETHRLSNLCDDLLLLSRAESNQVKLTYTKISVRDFLIEIIDLMGVLALEKSQTINLHCDENLKVELDKKYFKQVLMNLLDNAIKYSPSSSKIDIEASELGSNLIIVVKDSGPGLKKEEQVQIFERFYRTENSRNRNSGGTGLGLSITKWIVQAHLGVIEVDSQLNQGSTFKVTIPKSKEIYEKNCD